MENTYEEQLRKISLRPESFELLRLILEDENIHSIRRDHMENHKTITDDILIQESLLAKARHLLVAGKIDDEDFNSLKQDYKRNINSLNERLRLVSLLLEDSNNNDTEYTHAASNIFQSYKHQDIYGKQFMIDLLQPSPINLGLRNIDSININNGLSKILTVKATSMRNVSFNQTYN